MSTKFVCISDSHCRLRKITIPEGDILIHSGDLTFQSNVQEILQELRELGRYKDKFKAIVLVEGNHDRLGENNPELMDQMCKDYGVTLLRDEGTIIEGFKFYGSPFQPAFGNWAFNMDRGDPALKAKWDAIPDDTQILVTHGPPMYVLDGIMRYRPERHEYEIENVGCYDLYDRVSNLANLNLHVFGHIHEGFGQLKKGNTTFVNASICTAEYKPTNPPIIIDL